MLEDRLAVRAFSSSDKAGPEPAEEEREVPETPEVAVEERKMGAVSVPDGVAAVAEEEGALGDGLLEEEGRCSLRGLLRKASTSRKASSTGFSGPKL